MLKEPFDNLYQKHAAEIYRYCYRIVKNRANAEELASETFVRAFFKADQFDPGKNYRSWIYQIAHNICIDFLRSPSYRKQRKTETLDTRMSLENDSSLPDEESEYEQLLKFLEECLTLLAFEERTTASLRHLEGFALQQIAEILGMKSPHSAKKRLIAAEKKLKKCLEEKGIDDNYWQSA